MTERRFYIGISFLPILLPLLAGAIAIPSINAQRGPPSGIAEGASFIFLTSMFSTIPYAIALAAVFWRLRAARSINLRRLIWSLPLWICLGFAPVFAVMSGTGGGMRSFAQAMLVGGLWALVIGYGYAVLIEVLHFIATHIGWIVQPESLEPDEIMQRSSGRGLGDQTPLS